MGLCWFIFIQPSVAVLPESLINETSTSMSASILTQRLQRLCLGVLRNGGQSKNLAIATPNALALQQQPEGGRQHFHTGQSLAGGYVPPDGPRKWLQYNKIVYEPQAEHEEQRPAVKYTFLL